MIPTIVVVNDSNPVLDDYAHFFSKLTRVIKRSSYQGERLYSDASGPFFEGILFFDTAGRKIIVRRDNYTTVATEITKCLLNSKPEVFQSIKSYLDLKSSIFDTPLSSLKHISVEAKESLKTYLSEIHDRK